MKENKYKWYFLVVLLLFVAYICISIIFTYESSKRVSGDVSCKISDIEYVDVNPYACWSEQIESEFCPLPKSLECSGSWDFPMSPSLIKEIVGGVG